MDTVGARLKNVRLEKGLTLDDVHKNTKINLSILRAIEEDNIIGFSPVYIKGFIKIYCRFLGVEPRDFIPDYKDHSGEARIAPQESPLLKNAAKPALLKRLVVFKSRFFKLAYLFRAKIAVFVALFVVAFTLFKLGKIISSKRGAVKEKSAPVAQVADEPVSRKAAQSPQKTKSKVSQPGKGSAKTAPDQKSSVSSGVRLTVRAKENCWLTIRADGKVVFQRILEKGRSEVWQAKEKIELSAGNAAAVELEVNGQMFSSLGRRGQALKNVIITKEGLNAP